MFAKVSKEEPKAFQNRLDIKIILHLWVNVNIKQIKIDIIGGLIFENITIYKQ